MQADHLDALRDQFPGWHAFLSRPEPDRLPRYWATRTGALRAKPRDLPLDASVKWSMTVDGDTPAELRLAIEEQQAIDDSG